MGRGHRPRGGLLHYRRLWWATVLLVAVPAIVTGMFISLVPVGVAAVTVMGFWIGSLLVGEDLSWRSWGDAAAGLVLMAAGTPALGHYALPLLMATAATSPPVARALLTATGTSVSLGRDDRPSETTADMMHACLGTMSGAELCELWGASYALVKSGRNVSQRLVGVGLRASLLDELERRDRKRFDDWLARRPCPASEPRWVTGPGHGSAP